MLLIFFDSLLHFVRKEIFSEIPTALRRMQIRMILLTSRRNETDFFSFRRKRDSNNVVSLFELPVLILTGFQVFILLFDTTISMQLDKIGSVL